jgi:hypothetical protein
MSASSETKTMRNAIGQDIPVHMVKEIDKLRDEFVRETVADFERISAMLAELKSRTEKNLDAFMEISAGRYGERLGGKRGGVVLFSYDGKYKLVRQYADYIVFDEGLSVAKEMLDRYLNSKLESADADLRMLIDRAFRPNSAGRLSTSSILGLRSVAINDPHWISAMHAISESLKVVSSKSYVRAYKQDEEGNWRPVCVDYPSVTPAKQPQLTGEQS